MLYRKIIAVCYQIHTKHINTLCGLNVVFLSVKPVGTYSDHCAVHIVTTGLKRLESEEAEVMGSRMLQYAGVQHSALILSCRVQHCLI